MKLQFLHLVLVPLSIILSITEIFGLRTRLIRHSESGLHGHVENLDLGSHIGSCFVHKHRLI